jgi:hypothetical protein
MRFWHTEQPYLAEALRTSYQPITETTLITTISCKEEKDIVGYFRHSEAIPGLQKITNNV